MLIARPGEPGVDASSILTLMSLALGPDEQVEVTSDDHDCLTTIANLIESDLDAP